VGNIVTYLIEERISNLEIELLNELLARNDTTSINTSLQNRFKLTLFKNLL